MKHIRSILITAGALAAAACGDDLQTPTLNGSLEITVSTSGSEPDADGYTVLISDRPGMPLGVNGTVQQDELEPGSYQVWLDGMAGNCSVAGGNPQSVSIEAGATAVVTFQVTCTTTAGSLQVSVVTNGSSPSADGYTVAVDGADRGLLGVNGSLALEGLPAGNHNVGLGGIAGNCAVQGENPRAVTVPSNGSASVEFVVSCSEPPPATGSIRVKTSTTGGASDPNGYAFAVDGGSSQPIGVNASTSVPNVAAGTRVIALSDVAEGCTVRGSNPRSIEVAAGATAAVTFNIHCAARTQTLTVTTLTSGANPDPDGYTVSLDGGSAQPIGANASVTLPGVDLGRHTVALGGIAENCTPEGDNPRRIQVTADAAASVEFKVLCSVEESDWNRIPLPDDFVAAGLWGTSPSDLFVTGSYPNGAGANDAVIVHYDGRTWTEQLRAGRASRSAIWGTSSTNVFAVASSAEIYSYDGTSWSSVGPPTQEIQTTWETIWGTSSTDVFAGGWVDAIPESGSIWHFDGATWSGTSGDLPGTYGEVTDIAGVSSADVYAIGSESPYDATPEEQITNWVVMHYDGTSWSRSFETRHNPSNGEVDYRLSAVWANAPDDVFVVGSGGRILHFDGRSWRPMASPGSRGLRDVWGNSGTNTYAVGEDGILHYDGSRWTRVDNRKAVRVWGTETDVFVAVEGAILHRQAS